MTMPESAASEIDTALLTNWAHSRIASVIYYYEVPKTTCCLIKKKSNRLMVISFLLFKQRK